MKVLILSMSCMHAHERAEFAVKEYMESNIKGSSVVIIDARKYFDPFVEKLVRGGILAAVRNNPVLYDKIYNESNDEDFPNKFNKTFNDILSEKLEELIGEFSPDIIISAHPFYLKMLCSLKQSGKVSMPVIALITEFIISRYWVHDFLEAYVIPQEDLKVELIRQGVDEKRIFPSGIPIQSEYLKSYDRISVLKGLGLSDKKTLLIMCGYLDGGPVKNIFKILASSGMDIQMIVVAGPNKRLKCQLENIAGNCPESIKIFGSTDRISELMSACHILISKPRSSLLVKAMAKGLPAVIIPPVPGNEAKISDYFVKHGAAVCLEKGNIENTVKHLLSDDERLQALKRNCAGLSKPDAAAGVAHLAAHIINNIK